jgi:hypothetical protein
MGTFEVLIKQYVAKICADSKVRQVHAGINGFHQAAILEALFLMTLPIF